MHANTLSSFLPLSAFRTLPPLLSCALSPLQNPPALARTRRPRQNPPALSKSRLPTPTQEALAELALPVAQCLAAVLTMRVGGDLSLVLPAPLFAGLENRRLRTGVREPELRTEVENRG